MIVIKKEIEDTSCRYKPCKNPSLYKFTTVKFKKKKKKRKIKVVIQGYSCMDHIDEVRSIINKKQDD